MLAALNTIPDCILILNEQRQTVFANKCLLDLLNTNDLDLLGKRPGEIFHCIHSDRNKNGCGTTEFCKYCGAADALFKRNEPDVTPTSCSLSVGLHAESMDLRIKATPLMIKNIEFIIFVIQDISDEVRRKVLEKTFFHDVLNTVGGLRGIVDLLQEDLEHASRYMGVLNLAVNTLLDEVRSQKILAAAENNDLGITNTELDSLMLINEVCHLYSDSNLGANCPLKVSLDSQSIIFASDHVILKRILSNMVKNALESSRNGQSVLIGCRRLDSKLLEFWVRNEEVIPLHIQMQIFHRSFSTKGKGRGIGTYSIKLLGEKYLNGHVSFISNAQEGTVFRIQLPL